jgi:hypothetical protein
MLTDCLNEERLECVVHECRRVLCLRERGSERKREREREGETEGGRDRERDRVRD